MINLNRPANFSADRIYLGQGSEFTEQELDQLGGGAAIFGSSLGQVGGALAQVVAKQV